MRPAGVLSWLLGDHLGSTTVTADGATGARTAELWYRPWGESRGTAFGATPTARRFTGQVLDSVADKVTVCSQADGACRAITLRQAQGEL